jgi:D-2-hydroxyacid dehydrogenase (NADP+)
VNSKGNKKEKVKILIMSRLAFKEKHKDMVLNVLPDADVRLALNAEEAGDFLAEADIMVTSNWDLKPDIFKRAKNLKWVHAISAGVEHLLFDELINSDVQLTNARGIFDTPAAEHTLAMMLAFSRGMLPIIQNQASKKWQRLEMVDLQGATLGIVGLGSIGRELARMAKTGFGMKVIATKRRMTDEKDVDVLLKPDQLPVLLAQADYVVLAAALTPETEGLIGEQELKLMKKNAVLINIARGPLVQEDALLQALQEGWIAGAGLDVFSKEPLSAESPFYELDNVIITAHRAGFTHHMLNDERIENFCENLDDYIHGRPLRTLVDKRLGY